MSQKIRAGVVGVGAIGKNHARIYSEIDSADLVAIYDSDNDAAQKIASSYGGKVAKSIDPNWPKNMSFYSFVSKFVICPRTLFLL